MVLILKLICRFIPGMSIQSNREYFGCRLLIFLSIAFSIRLPKIHRLDINRRLILINFLPISRLDWIDNLVYIMKLEVKFPISGESRMILTQQSQLLQPPR